MMGREHYVAELREAERLAYRARCRVRCLEANLDRIDPEDFEPLMESLEAAQQEVLDAAYRETLARFALFGCEKRLSGTDGTEQP